MNTVKFRPHPGAAAPFNELLNSFFGRDLAQFYGSDDQHRITPRVNITESNTGFRLEMLVPGFSKEDLKMSVEEGTLTISAEHKDMQLNEHERFTRREFSKASFQRAFRLPKSCKHDEISASFTNGVLVVSIPKAEVAKPATREININ